MIKQVRQAAYQTVAAHTAHARSGKRIEWKPWPKNQIDHGHADWHTMPITSPRMAIMPTRNVVITEQQAAMLERLVHSGRYQNASEVLREGLRLIERQEKENDHRLAALKAAVQVGINEIEAGHFKRFDSALALSEHINSVGTRALKGD